MTDNSQQTQVQVIPPATMRTDDQVVREELGEENAAIALAICDRLASSADSLEQIAGEIRGMDGAHAARQFYRWRIRSAALSRIYARACNSRAHVIAQQLMDTIEREACPHKARVKMDALKWLAARYNRADFGDEPSAGVQVTINNDAGSSALAAIQERLARKRKQLQTEQRSSSEAVAHSQAAPGKSMLSGPGVRVEEPGAGEGEGAERPHDLPLRP